MYIELVHNCICTLGAILHTSPDIMDGGEFYLTLPSNASQDVYGNNTISNYRTKLAKPIILKEPYEVGLIELQYPRTWYTFTDRVDGEITFIDTGGNTAEVTLVPGVYVDIRSIVTEINNLLPLQTLTKKITLMYNVITNRAFFMNAEGLIVTFKGRLAIILGFKPGKPFSIPSLKHSKKYAPHPADIYGGYYNIYIYTDIADYQLVGNSYVNLLRTINIADEKRTMPHVQYDRPHYTPLSRSVIGDIEISLKTDQDLYVPFTYGKVIVKLHFRPLRRRL